MDIAETSSAFKCAGLPLCALCRQNVCAEQSHIIPAFVYRWLKKNSITGHLRGTKSPNLRKPDGPKRLLLCPACEDMFAAWESQFAKILFHPVHEHPHDLSCKYGDWLPKFCVSVTWRALLAGILQEPQSEIPHGQSGLIQPTLEVWREYLLQQRSDVGFHRQHLIALGNPVSMTGSEISLSDARIYFERAIEYNTMHAPDEAYVMVKLCRVLIVGTIFDKKPSKWKRTQVQLEGGEFSPGEIQISGCVSKFFETAVDLMKKARKEVSATQKGKIEDAFFQKWGVRMKQKD